MIRTLVARRGFTLVEMLVVIVILAIVSAVTIPAFRSNSDDQLANAVRVITTLMQRSRQTAIERGENVTLVVDAEHARYWAVVHGTSRADSVVSYGAIEMSSGATLSSDALRSRFLFEPSGSASGPSLVVKVDSRAAVIALDRWTGDAHAQTQ